MLTSQDVSCHKKIRLVGQKWKLVNTSLNPLIDNSSFLTSLKRQGWSHVYAYLTRCDLPYENQASVTKKEII